jgi:hypothetical protein
VLVLVVISVLMVTVRASAGDKLGIANYQKISFSGNVRVGRCGYATGRL